MASWKKIIALDSTPVAENSFITVNTDDSVEVIRFGDLPAITPGTDQDVANVLANNPTNFLFVVDDTSDNDHKKVTFDDIAGGIAAALAEGLTTEQTAYFTGDVSGLPADLNGDGSVSTADLLEFLTAFGGISDGLDSSVRITTTASATLDETNIGQANAEVIPFTTSDASITAGNCALTIDGTNDKIVFSNTTAGTNQSNNWFQGNSNREYRFSVESGDNAFTTTAQVIGERIYVDAKIESFDAVSGGNSLGVRYEPLGFISISDAGENEFTLLNSADAILHENSTNGLLQGVAQRAEISFVAYTDLGTGCSVEINDIDVTIVEVF